MPKRFSSVLLATSNQSGRTANIGISKLNEIMAKNDVRIKDT